MIKELVKNRWFTLGELLLALGCGTAWYFQPSLGWKLLGIALLPWLLRILAKSSPIRLTNLELPMLIFLGSVLVAAWVSYDQQNSWSKFWLMLGAILLYYAIGNQPKENYWIIARIISVLGLILSVYFLLAYDWQKTPVKIELINRLGRQWMSLRPATGLTAPDLDAITGTLLVIFPFPIALLWEAWRQDPPRWVSFTGSALILLVLISSLVLAAMTEAVLVVISGLILLAGWLLSKKIDSLIHQSTQSIFLAGICILVLIMGWLLVSFSSELTSLATNLPVLSRIPERLQITKDVLAILEDFPFTGGGLASFPGLYSKYILVIPFFYIPNSYNFFTEILLEIGVIGFWAYLVLFFGTAFSVVRRVWSGVDHQEELAFILAALAGLWAVLIIGIFDVILFTGFGTLFILLLPGLGRSLKHTPGKKAWGFALIFPGLLVFFASFLSIRGMGKSLPAVFYGNIGSVQMAKHDLKDWPWNEAETPPATDENTIPVWYFEHALAIDPDNHTANHQLGLILMRRQDFTHAREHLEKAVQTTSWDRGVLKNLGYCYVWLGDYDRALGYLGTFPEATYELSVYSWWWKTQSRDDLSQSAFHIADLMAAK